MPLSEFAGQLSVVGLRNLSASRNESLDLPTLNVVITSNYRKCEKRTYTAMGFAGTAQSADDSYDASARNCSGLRT